MKNFIKEWTTQDKKEEASSSGPIEEIPSLTVQYGLNTFALPVINGQDETPVSNPIEIPGLF